MAEKSDMSTVKLLESGKKARELLNKLNEPQLTVGEMCDLLCLVCKEMSALKLWTSSLTQIAERGARWFYKYAPTTAEQLGLDAETIKIIDDEIDRDPWQISRLRARFCNECRIQFAEKMNGLDALSQIGALAFDDPRDSERWQSVNPLVWTSWAGRGNNAVVRGAVKRGKSNLALLLAEYFLATGKFEVVSNIIVTDPPKGYTYCPMLSSMFIAICNARLAGKEVLIALDEANLFWQKIETIMPKNISLSKLILCFGKMHSNLLFISHYEELIPTIVSRTAVANFEKKSIKECFVTISEGIRLKPKLLTGVPATTMKYNPDQLAYFAIDLSVDALFNFMASLPEKTEQWGAVLEYVEKHLGEVGEEQLDPKEVAVWLKRRGKSERAIADLVQRSPSTVHDWVTSTGSKKTEQRIS